MSNRGMGRMMADSWCNCGGGVLASPSACPRLALMGQQACTDKHRLHFTSGRVIRESLCSIAGEEPFIHSTAGWLWMDLEEKWLKDMLICSTQHFICWSDSADITQHFHPHLSWHTGLSIPVLFNPVETSCIQATSLLPGDRYRGPETRDWM